MAERFINLLQNYINLQLIKFLKTKQPRRILDPGADNSPFCRLLLKRGFIVAEIEPDLDGVLIAKQQSTSIPF